MKTVYKKRIAKEFLYFLGVVLLLLSLWGIIGLWNLYWDRFYNFESKKIEKQIESNKLKVEYLSDDINNLEKKKHRRNDFYVKIVFLPYLTDLIFAKKQSDIDSLINLLNDLKISKQKQKEKEKEEYNKRNPTPYGETKVDSWIGGVLSPDDIEASLMGGLLKRDIDPFASIQRDMPQHPRSSVEIAAEIELERRRKEEALSREAFNPFRIEHYSDTLSAYTDFFGRSKKKPKYYFQEFWGKIKEKKEIFFYHLDSETKYLLGIDSLKNLDQLFITKKDILDEKEMLRLQKEESRLLSKSTNIYHQYKRNHLNIKKILLTCGIILFALLYPIRMIIISILWSVKTLRDRS